MSSHVAMPAAASARENSHRPPAVSHTPSVPSHSLGPASFRCSAVILHLCSARGPFSSLAPRVSLPRIPILSLARRYASIVTSSFSLSGPSIKCSTLHSSGCVSRHPSLAHVAASSASTTILAASPSPPSIALSIWSHSAAAAYAYACSCASPLARVAYIVARGVAVVNPRLRNASPLACSISSASSHLITVARP